jgi:hypothetical protein
MRNSRVHRSRLVESGARLASGALGDAPDVAGSVGGPPADGVSELVRGWPDDLPQRSGCDADESCFGRDLNHG